MKHKIISINKDAGNFNENNIKSSIKINNAYENKYLYIHKIKSYTNCPLFIKIDDVETCNVHYLQNKIGVYKPYMSVRLNNNDISNNIRNVLSCLDSYFSSSTVRSFVIKSGIGYYNKIIKDESTYFNFKIKHTPNLEFIIDGVKVQSTIDKLHEILKMKGNVTLTIRVDSIWKTKVSMAYGVLLYLDKLEFHSAYTIYNILPHYDTFTLKKAYQEHEMNLQKYITSVQIKSLDI